MFCNFFFLFCFKVIPTHPAHLEYCFWSWLGRWSECPEWMFMGLFKYAAPNVKMTRRGGPDIHFVMKIRSKNRVSDSSTIQFFFPESKWGLKDNDIHSPWNTTAPYNWTKLNHNKHSTLASTWCQELCQIKSPDSLDCVMICWMAPITLAQLFSTAALANELAN